MTTGSDRIGVAAQLATMTTGATWLERGRRVEALGFTGVSLPDHLGSTPAPLVSLAALATVTERLTLTTNVLATDFRHPAILAKELATLDVLSSGRVVAGIGAGWMIDDYEPAGIVMDRPGIRIDRMLEAVAVLRGLWADEPCTFTGEHYRITALDGLPKPVQRPGPRVLLGGGARRVLTEAGRHADVVGLATDNRAGVVGDGVPGIGLTLASVHEKLAWVAEGAAGRAVPPALSIRVRGVAVTDDDGHRAAADLGRAVGLDADDVLASPYFLVGSPTAIADALRRRRDELGIGEVVVSETAIDPLAPILERLACGS
jgi:probable F420-dependent oxidoreductase